MPNMPMIIAEAGVNHNGDVKCAIDMIDAAKAAGADAVKFQTFRADDLASVLAPKANYQKKSGDESQYEMLKKLELTRSEFIKLKEYADFQEIMFMSSAFDTDSIDFLESINITVHKIPSGEITNLPYIRKIARLGKPVILSTGMCTLGEVKTAVELLANCDLTLLHCNTQYPTELKDANIKAMLTLHREFGCKYGYSDHTKGIEAAVAAAALGASVIEKHFTLDKSMQGPDHAASLDVKELSALVTAVRNVAVALGNGIKQPTLSELENITAARKSIVASKDIAQGDVFTEKNITVKRPGDGLSPMLWDKVIGSKARKGFSKDEKIDI